MHVVKQHINPGPGRELVAFMAVVRFRFSPPMTEASARRLIEIEMGHTALPAIDSLEFDEPDPSSADVEPEREHDEC